MKVNMGDSWGTERLGFLIDGQVLENFAEVANKFFFGGLGQTTLSSPHNR